MKRNGKTKATSDSVKMLLVAAGNPPTIEDAITRVVSELLQSVSLPPTNLDGLRERLNIVGVSAEDGPFSGHLRREGSGLKIIYSIHLSENRRRFTIAHEMGHALLNKLGQPLPHSGAEVERLCDKLAAEILMPKDVFLNRLGHLLTIERLFDLKRIFKVSLSAIALRCFQLKRDSVFEVESGTVSWGAGLVKKGPFHLIEGGLQLGIEEAAKKEKGNLEVFFVDRGNTYKGELEWSQRSPQKTLFILRRNNSCELSVTSPRFLVAPM